MNRTNEGYEVVLGIKGNTASTVRVIGGPMQEFSTPNILDCSVTRYFWISWKNGYIAIGTTSDQPIIVWQPPTSPISISAVTLANNGSQTALWYIDPRVGKLMYFKIFFQDKFFLAILRRYWLPH